MRQEGVDLRFRHLSRVTYGVKTDEPFDSGDRCLFRAAAGMAGTQCLAQPVRQFRRLGRARRGGFSPCKHAGGIHFPVPRGFRQSVVFWAYL